MSGALGDDMGFFEWKASKEIYDELKEFCRGISVHNFLYEKVEINKSERKYGKDNKGKVFGRYF